MKLGETLVNQKFLSDYELNFALEDQRHNQKLLGEILVELGFISKTLLDIYFCLENKKNNKNLHLENSYKSIYEFSKGEFIYKYGNLIFSTRNFFEKYSFSKLGYQLFEIEKNKGINIIFEDSPQISLSSPNVFLRTLIDYALNFDITDFHFEPFYNLVRLKIRKLGKINYILNFSKEFYKKFLISLKSLSNLDYTKTQVPQDSRLYVKSSKGKIYLRLSFLPGIYGENLVIRVLNKKGGILKLDHLGLKETDLNVLKNVRKLKHGLVLICGPTGSGKTTTLYALIRELFSPEKNIICIEDPVEYLYPAVRQIEINEKLSFFDALKASLRQDPDIIVLGEIRDENTAKTVLRAAQTGHLVIASLHAYSFETTISRLINLGLKEEEIKEVLKLVIIQDLKDVKCPFCFGKGCNLCFKGVFDKKPNLKIFENFPT